ncbi:MAG: ABC transporter substrate-binding protein [Streptococcaceae bacterium]|nr:ABC transporter substrate-binding protein [Streptococcaceae bacterium]
MKQTKKMVTIGLACLASITLVACGNSTSSKAKPAAKDDYVLKLADNSDLCGAPQHAAIEEGFFKKEGLKYELVKLGDDTSNLAALSSGKIDASNSLVGSLVQPLVNGTQLKITTGLHTGCLQILTKEGSSIKTAKDLKGKKIGVTSIAGSPATFARRFAASGGLDATQNSKDISFVAYQSDQLGQVLDKGEVDAIAVGDPTPAILESNYKFETLADSSTTEPYNNEYCCVAYVSTEIAKKHPEIARKYTIALQKAAKWVAEHGSETVKMQHDHNYVAGDTKTNEKALTAYKWKPSYKGGEKAFETVAKDLQTIGVIDKDVDLAAVEKASFLKVDGVE